MRRRFKSHSFIFVKGKSNLMDAISFVLGVKSMHLRSNQLKDLIYGGKVAENGVLEDRQRRKFASVVAVYERSDKKIIRFTRRYNN
jgi:structural maintenance of chromosome 1